MERTKQRIRDQLLEMMKTQDVGAIKVTALADGAEVSRSTFYTYYDSVYAVLQDIEDRYFRDFGRAMAPTAELQFDDRYFDEPAPMVVAALEYLHSQQDLVAVLRGAHGDGVFQYRGRRVIRQTLYDKAIAERYIPMDSEQAAAFWVGGMEEAIADWMRNEPELEPQRLALILYRLMFGGRHRLRDRARPGSP